MPWGQIYKGVYKTRTRRRSKVIASCRVTISSQKCRHWGELKRRVVDKADGWTTVECTCGGNGVTV